MQVKLHWAESFMNWFPAHTKLYIRGQRGKDWNEQRALDKELFDQLVPFLDMLRAEAKAEEREECAKLCEAEMRIAAYSPHARQAISLCTEAIRGRSKE